MVYCWNCHPLWRSSSDVMNRDKKCQVSVVISRHATLHKLLKSRDFQEFGYHIPEICSRGTPAGQSKGTNHNCEVHDCSNSSDFHARGTVALPKEAALSDLLEFSSLYVEYATPGDLHKLYGSLIVSAKYGSIEPTLRRPQAKASIRKTSIFPLTTYV